MEQHQKRFLNILKAALRGEHYEPVENISPEEWEAVFRLAREHQLLPMIFEASFQCPGFRGTPLQAAIRQQVLRDVFLQTRKTGEFLQLYRSLRDSGVTPLVVKGIICRNLYPQPDYRASSDEDVLIPKDQLDICHGAMTAFGMETAEDPAHFDKMYEIPYGKKGSPIYIELHKQLFPPESQAYGELNDFFEGVFDRAVEEKIEGTGILTMAPTDHLFYLICHAFKHFLHGGFGIRQVCDIVLFAGRYGEQIDWKRVLENCRQIRADKFAATMFRMGRNHLGLDVTVPDFWQTDVDERAMLEDLLASGIYGGADMERKHSSNITLNAVVRQKQGKDTGGGVFKSLFPGVDALEGRYPYLKKYPFLLPAAWISRIFGFLLRRGGTERAAKTVQLGNERIELLKQYGILDE